MIYFDNAATSWPKPPGVTEAMVGTFRNGAAELEPYGVCVVRMK